MKLRRMDNKLVTPLHTRRESGPLRLSNRFWRNLLGRRESFALAFLIIISVLLSLQTDTFFTVNNLSNISLSLSHIAIAAFGECMVIIIGGIDVSVGAVMALAGLISALCVQAHVPVPVAVVAGISTGGLVGWVNGNLVGRMRLPSFIVTLASTSVVRGIIVILTGGWPVRELPQGFRMLGQYDLQVGSLPIPLPALFMLGLATLVSLLMSGTVVGEYIYTLANNERALLVSGVDVVRIKVLVYTICGTLAAIGGVLMTARLGVAAPTAATGYELDIIAAAVVGGTSLFGGQGSIPGVLLGAAVMQVIRNGLVLVGFSAYWQTAVLGTMILIFILLDYWRRKRQ
jgi:ribose transport system permease protein